MSLSLTLNIFTPFSSVSIVNIDYVFDGVFKALFNNLVIITLIPFQVRLHVKMSNKCSDTIIKNDSNSPQNMLAVDSTDGPRGRVSPTLLPAHKFNFKGMSLPRSSKPSHNNYPYENISNLPTSRSDGQLADQLFPPDTKKRLMDEIRKAGGVSPSGTLEKNISQSLEVLTLGEEPLSDDDEEDDDSQWNFQCTATRL